MKAHLAAFAAVGLLISAPALAQEPIYIGDNDSGNACESDNWSKVGFSSYEECVAALGEPAGDDDTDGPHGGGRTGVGPYYGCQGRTASC